MTAESHKMDFALARVSYDSSELLTMTQIAKLTGLSYWYIRALHSGSERPQVAFPRPDTRIGRSPLWTKTAVRQWMKDRKRSVKH